MKRSVPSLLKAGSNLSPSSKRLLMYLLLGVPQGSIVSFGLCGRTTFYKSCHELAAVGIDLNRVPAVPRGNRLCGMLANAGWLVSTHH